MSFQEILHKYRDFSWGDFFAGVDEKAIKTVLGKDRLTPIDFMTLLSPEAENHLEAMAQKAQRLTAQYFGRTILLYTPLYLSNFCANQCVYCGFASHTGSKRKQLTPEEVYAEGKAIASTGLKHILLLTGDAPQIATVDYIAECINVLRPLFSSIGLEIYSLTEDDYSKLTLAGAESLTLYQETYNPDLYDRIHVRGPKKDYLFRINAPERACRAGIRCLNIGALLGLDEWQKDACFTGLHAHYLQCRYPGVEISISLPRMRPHLGGYQPNAIVSDKNMVQFLLAYRLFMPWAGITISTRERPSFRNNLLGLGVTKMSAGVSTKVGGRASEEETPGQFDISDGRSVADMCRDLRRFGFQPVFKNWEAI
jgi:2-iminoacetate synthase